MASGVSRGAMERLMRIHNTVCTGSYPNASNLALELEVSTKSVHRDIEFMRDRLNLPIEFDPSKNGYHYTEKVSSFPSLQLTEGELFALIVAEKALQQYRGTPFEKPLLAAFRKMADSLPDTVAVNWADWDRTISFRTTAEPILNLDIFDRLAKATALQRTLKIEYRKAGAKAAEWRTIDPYQLANINGEWFLFAHDHLRKSLRTFVPARIRSMQETGAKFKRPSNFSLERTLQDSFGVRSGSQATQVQIRFSEKVADYIREKRWHPSQELKSRRDGSVELSMVVSNLEEVMRWVLGWGGEAEVIKPAELRAKIKEAARIILKKNSG